MKIIEKEQLNSNTYSLWIESGIRFFPGQFVQIKCGDETTLRRPISVCDVKGGAFRIVFSVRGKGTTWLAKCAVGEKLDIIAPLGNTYPEFEKKKIAIVGGGIGTPPMLYLAKKLAKNNDITAVLGFRNESEVILKNEFEAVCETIITTDDKTVIDGLETDDFDVILACGPVPMYKAIEKLGKPTFVSLEERMGCGFGACYGCSVRLSGEKEKYARVCHDGPVFNLAEVVL